jgi:CHAT domain-containing protein/tetratricopeptide (TPR) repeat protein
VGDAECLEVAAGLLPEAKTRELMKHAAQCGHCGPLLKNAAEALVDETTPSEEAWLASLRSARPEWQKNVAATLRISAGAKDRSREKKDGAPWWQALFSSPRTAFALAGIAVAVLAGWLGLRILHPPSAEQLLAQAYTEHRTLEVRIPGAKYAPMRVERAAGESSLDKSPSLLKAEALIGENLRKNPNDTAWLQAKARADLLDGNYESAIKSLQRALETQPDDPTLLTDLGSAYFVRAEATDRAVDYGNAIESLSKALAKSPDDPVALFNRALACERMFLFTQAVDDWEHYLRVEPQGEWSEDARTNLNRVKQKMAEKEKRSAAPLLSPKEFAAAIDANHEDAIAMLDQRAERYLETAIQSWLPLAYGDSGGSQATPADARHALEYLAEILKSRHDDTWLTDFLQNPPKPTQKEALHALLASDEALHTGRYGLSVELAKKSVRDFQVSRSQAGRLRAMFALTLAQTVALRTSDCLSTTSAASPLLLATSYRWVQTQTLIQQGQCQSATSQMEDALRSTSKGDELAKRFHYPGLQLRATAFAAGYRRDMGSADRGMRDLINGLVVFWQSDAPSARGGNLYTVLEGIAGTRNWHHVEAFTIAEQISDFPVKDPVDQAVQRELLAGAQERAGDYKGAQATLRSTAAQLASLPEDSAVALRQAQIARENAKIQLHLGDAQGALATLSVLRRQFETAEPGLFQAEYFKTYGEASLTLGLDASAEPLFESALSVTETGLRGLQSEVDKLAWSRTQGEIYRDLLGIKLKSATPAGALALWEWYKGASLRAADSENSALFAGGGIRMLAPPEASTYALAPGTALISYSVLRESTTAFVFRDGGVQSHALHLPNEPNLQPLRFLSLCADPSSDLNSFDAESRHLYQILIAPLEADIHGVTALRIETDGILDQIPFDLLRGPDGRYLADRFEVTYSPGLAYASHPGGDALSAASLALIVVASGEQDPSLTPLPEAEEEGNDVASYFRGAKVLSGSRLTRADVLRNLRDAKIFHFVGHAVAGVDHVGLVVGPDAVVNSGDLVKLRPRNLQLAVLSACDTANGDEGTFGDVNSIARTLAVAGVPQTIASRWKVDSAVTRQLMRAFYSNLMSGKTPADSLRAATVAVRNLPGYQHPYYWGSFAVFGGS